MALYLGREKIAVSIPTETQKFVGGTIDSNEYGEVYFPQLHFEPKLIALWNVEPLDLKEDAEQDGEGWDESYEVLSGSSGFMLFAIYKDGRWYSQSLGTDSGAIYITNESFDADGDGFPDNPPFTNTSVENLGDGYYVYYMNRNKAYLDATSIVTMNYAIYG